MKAKLRAALLLLRGLSCTRRRMRECHPGCGHHSCPDCGVTWDHYAEK